MTGHESQSWVSQQAGHPRCAHDLDWAPCAGHVLRHFLVLVGGEQVQAHAAAIIDGLIMKEETVDCRRAPSLGKLSPSHWRYNKDKNAPMCEGQLSSVWTKNQRLSARRSLWADSIRWFRVQTATVHSLSRSRSMNSVRTGTRKD